jgi:hypothetical protein
MIHVYVVRVDRRKLICIQRQAPLIAENQCAAAETLDLHQQLTLDIDLENFQCSILKAYEQQFSIIRLDELRPCDVLSM